MNVNNHLQALQQLFSSERVTTAREVQKPGGDGQRVLADTDEATLSFAASLASKGPADSDVRMEKVAQVQQALAAGTYDIPGSAVAGKIIDHMLGD